MLSLFRYFSEFKPPRGILQLLIWNVRLVRVYRDEFTRIERSCPPPSCGLVEVVVREGPCASLREFVLQLFHIASQLFKLQLFLFNLFVC